MMNYKALTLIAAALTFAAPAIAANLQAGKAYMEKHCAQCHGKDGSGNGPALAIIGANVTPKNWTSKAAMSGLSDADLTNIITKGGAAVGKSNFMPAFGAKASPAKIADMVAYIRSLAK
jgi:mono/diheme cytochrome c family protein